MRLNWKTFAFVIAISVWGAAFAHAGAANLAASATLVSSHNCRFNTNGALALPFGLLDPLAPADVTRTATIDFDCSGNKNNPVIFSVIDDDGLYETGSNANQMKHATMGGANAFIPYSFSVSPSSGTTATKTAVNVTVTGTVLGSAYQTVYAGAYTDTVTIQVEP
jgi:hypothetical protein